jgi:large conductance mechanosensitive channel
MLAEFKQFLLRGNIVDLAVAFVIGVAFAALINSLVVDLLTPVIAAILGKPDFSGLDFTINGSVFHYGSFLNALISFVSIAAAVFFLVVKPMSVINARNAPPQAPADRQVPGVPERDPRRRPPLRPLHHRGEPCRIGDQPAPSKLASWTTARSK